MHLEEWERSTPCAECGAEIEGSGDPAYAYADRAGAEHALCGVCASRRGGVYDLDLDRWAVLPDLSGLFGAERPHL
jgi:hypothetical protein